MESLTSAMVGTAIPVKCSPIDDFIAVIKKKQREKIENQFTSDWWKTTKTHRNFGLCFVVF